MVFMAGEKRLCMQCMLEIDNRDVICPYCGYPVGSKQPKPFLTQGAVLEGKYLVGKMIKRNADSAVYIGRDVVLSRTIEIREFFPSTVAVRNDDMIGVSAGEGYADIYAEYLESFIRLWKNLMRFKGLPALFEVYNVFELNGTAYAVTDHNESTTFRKILDTMNVEANPFSLSRTTTLIMSILSTVESLHTANVVHRGISPESLVLSSDGTLKITGFAIAQVRTTKNKIINSVCDGYAAIEQYDFNWQQGSWTDIYSIGALIYKMLTGRTLPPAPSRLNDEEVFFTDEERSRIPPKIIDLIEGCLVLMPQGRMKDIHDIIDVFKPKEMSAKTVTAVRNRAVFRESKEEKASTAPVVRAANVLIPESQRIREKQALEQEKKPLEIIKPQQAEAVTKTTIVKPYAPSNEQKLREQQEALEEKRRREELFLKHQEELAREKAEAERLRKQYDEQLRQQNKESRRRIMENSAAGRAVVKAGDEADKIKKKINKGVKKSINPATAAVGIAVLVSVTCVFITFLLYGTVLYKYVDAPILDNCLSNFFFLPVNNDRSDAEEIEYVSVADFRNLTKEYIENDPIYAKRYKIEFVYDYCDTVRAGLVFSQSVQPEEKVPVGSPITVFISKGIQMITFIDVKGMQYAEAEKQLTEAGFTVIRNEVYNIGFYKQDEVKSYSLVAGDEYPKGTEVTLNVWSAPPLSPPTTTQPSDQPSQSQPQQNNDGGLFSLLRDWFGF